jgi:hypothetical protein
VDVTLSLDTNQLNPGETTTLRVFGEIVPALVSSSDRIFSWYIDVRAEGVSAAVPDYEALSMATSDNFPGFSSPGTTDGTRRRGIHNTFMSREAAGKGTPVELAAVPVRAVSPGAATYSVLAGTAVAKLSEDFLVARAGGGTPFAGGNYAAARITLTVGDAGLPRLSIDTALGGVLISWTPVDGVDQYLQFRDDRLMGRSGWTTFMGGPHNGGSIIDLTGDRWRSYRLVRD